MSHRHSSQPIHPNQAPLRVGIVTHSLPFDSAEAFFYPELRILAELGCELTVFPAAARTLKRIHSDLDVSFVRFYPLGPRTLFRAWRGLRRNVRAAWQALCMIISANTRIGIKLKNFILFATGLAVGDEACERGLSHIHSYWLTGSSTVGVIAAKIAGIGWSYSAITHDIFVQDNLIAEKMIAASFGRVISQKGRVALISQSRNSTYGRLEVIHLGVDVANQSAISQSPCGTIRLLCAAYFIPVKGHAYLVKALRHVVDTGIRVHCTFAGDGHLLNAVAKQARKLKLDSHVTFLGMIAHTDLLQRIHSGAFDATVLASIELGTQFEGIPMSLMESMAAGLPCIATRTGSIGELIDARCGILVKERDPAALTDAIVLLASDPSLRHKLGLQARHKVAMLFNAVSSARALKYLFDSVTPNAHMFAGLDGPRRTKEASN